MALVAIVILIFIAGKESAHTHQEQQIFIGKELQLVVASFVLHSFILSLPLVYETIYG